MTIKNYTETVKQIKSAILHSRYITAKVANKEMLFLYFKVGKTISEKVASEKWGSKTIEKLSGDLQNELKGLRGFSSANLKYMKRFYEEWSPYLQVNISQNQISQTVSDQIQETDNQQNIIGSSVTNQFKTIPAYLY